MAEQRGWTAEELEAREAAQLPLTAKAAHADHALDNSASLDHLERQVDELVRRWGRASEAAPAAQLEGPIHSLDTLPLATAARFTPTPYR